MKFLVFLFAVLAVLAMASATNPMCNEAAQAGDGYQVYVMSTQARSYGSSNNYHRQG